MKVHTFPSESRGLKVPPTPAYARPAYTRLHPPTPTYARPAYTHLRPPTPAYTSLHPLMPASGIRCHWDLLHVVKMQDEYRGDLLFVLMSVSPAVKQGAA